MSRPARCRTARAWPPAERRRALTGTPRTTSDKATATGAVASTQPGWAGDRPGLWLKDAADKIGPAPQAPHRLRAWSILVRNITFRRIRACRPIGLSTGGPPREARGHSRRANQPIKRRQQRKASQRHSPLTAKSPYEPRDDRVCVAMSERSWRCVNLVARQGRGDLCAAPAGHPSLIAELSDNSPRP